MIESRPYYGEGLFRRNSVGDKVYTNLRFTFRGLGFIKEEKKDSFIYDFSSIFSIANINRSLEKMFLLKLKYAGMKNNSEFVDTLIKFSFNLVFGLKSSEFIEWLFDDAIIFNEVLEQSKSIGVEDKLLFESGHISRNELSKQFSLKSKVIKTTFLHNKIQNELYKVLSTKYGQENVGTEQPVGKKRIDVVLKNNDNYIYYEIKTTLDDVQSIRQALPQLMEYAYFPNHNRAKKLIIVSPAKVSKNTKLYIKKLRDDFNIPVWFISYDETFNKFLDEV